MTLQTLDNRPFPASLYTAAEVRALDTAAIAAGTPGILLMKRAGRAVYAAVRQAYPGVQPLTVFCGAGNNAGDGYVVAGLAAQQGVPVRVIQVGPLEKLTGDARLAYDFACQERVEIVPFETARLPTDGVVIDALLGIGLKGTVREPFAQAIEQINRCGLTDVAVDISTEINANTVAVQGCRVQDALTVTIIGTKSSLLIDRDPELYGDVVLANLGEAEN